MSSGLWENWHLCREGMNWPTWEMLREELKARFLAFWTEGGCCRVGGAA